MAPAASYTRASATERPGGPSIVLSILFASTSSAAVHTAPSSEQTENGPIRTVRSSFEPGVTLTSQRSFFGASRRRTFGARLAPPWRIRRV